MDPVTTPWTELLGYITEIINKVPTWVGKTLEVFTAQGNELLLFSALIGFIGIGIGLLRRFFKLHA